MTLCVMTVFAYGTAAGEDYKGSDPAGTVSYALPVTTLTFEVEARREVFHAGPYSRYAEKYLGVQARQKDETNWQVTAVRMRSLVEADPARRFQVEIGNREASASFFTLSTQGLVCLPGGSAGAGEWRFPVDTRGEFASRAAVSPLGKASATLYKNAGGKDFRQEMVVEKSLEKQASETAELIFSLRTKRVQIITGDTDATYSGEAMKAALDEMERLEKDYLILFTGYSETDLQKKTFELTPAADAPSQTYVAFRISDAEGLVGADNLSGKPVVLKLEPSRPAAPASEHRANTKVRTVTYRIPAVCRAQLHFGKEILLDTRVPVFQLGVESLWPLNLPTR